MRRSVPLALYRFGTGLIEGVGPAFLRRRLARGKEDAERLGERLGHAGAPRPPGPLAWVHGASVGEGLALLPFVDCLMARGFTVLVTTGTVSSSRVLATRLPAGALHQFVPLDLPAAARRFFDHWRPDLVCFAESELWPNLLGEAQRRGTPSALVNARMSARSFARWRRMPGLIGPILGGFAQILAQSEGDRERLSALGASAVIHTGNLKFDVPPPLADPALLAELWTAVGERPVWVASSTHAGEDVTCIAAHAALIKTIPSLLTILVPRRSERGAAIADSAAASGLVVRRRSAGETLDAKTGVYVADTMGELGLFYRLSDIVFVGKSLTPDGGGQTPIEPTKLGSAILHGPHVSNFADTYAALDKAGGALTVADEPALVAALGRLLADHNAVRRMADSAAAVVTSLEGATARTMAALEPLCVRILGAAP